jgi:TolA-binding protein
LSDAITQFRTHRKFSEAIDIARSLPPLLDETESLLLEGATYRDWAEETIRANTNVAGDISREASETARRYFRIAGEAFQAAATLDFEKPRYLTSLWAAIEAFQKGRQFTRSIELLEPYLRYEERERRPRGLVAYGRALMADDRLKEAAATLAECVMDNPRDPLRYDARLLAAQVNAELGNAEIADQMLQGNLLDEDLTPQSPAWQESLFMIGDLALREALKKDQLAVNAPAEKQLELLRDNQSQMKKAARFLNEAIERYPLTEASHRAAYDLARIHRLLSKLPRRESEHSEAADAAKRTFRAQADAALEMARDRFATTAELLIEQDENAKLSDASKLILRNCLIAEADVLLELRDFEQAMVAYREISIRYMNQPAALEALLGQSRCLNELGRDLEAQGVLRQALAVLERIPTELDNSFETITRYDRAGWQRLLSWMIDRQNNNSTLTGTDA